MSNQDSLFDMPEAIAERDAAMADVEYHADQVWLDQAWDAIVEYLETHAEFFVDDFWRNAGGLEEPREARALGPLVQRAARRKMIEPTGRHRPSVRSHGSGKPVWRSLIYREAT